MFVADRPLPDLVVLPIDEALKFFSELSLPGWRGEIAAKIVKESANASASWSMWAWIT